MFGENRHRSNIGRLHTTLQANVRVRLIELNDTTYSEGEIELYELADANKIDFHTSWNSFLVCLTIS